MPNLITNIQQATAKGHTVAIVLGVLAATAMKFLHDPHVTAYVVAHWWAGYVESLISGVIIALIAYYRTQGTTQ